MSIVYEIYSKVDEHIDLKLSSQLCGIGYSYFKRLFIQKFNQPPKEYVTRIRLERALELLKIGHYSVWQIAEMTGYSNVYYFSKVFKEHYGGPPSRYEI